MTNWFNDCMDSTKNDLTEVKAKNILVKTYFKNQYHYYFQEPFENRRTYKWFDKESEKVHQSADFELHIR